MKKSLVIGNWKMNGNLVENEKLLNDISTLDALKSSIDVVICSPFIYIDQVSKLLSQSNIKYGAQNVSAYQIGAYTGEVSTTMLHDFGCSYVLLGHSERRSLYHESDVEIADKFSAVVQAGITPVLCVGETLAQRQSEKTFAVIAEQISSVVEQVGIKAFERAVIAYEPVWAIGTGETATPEQAQIVHARIRYQLAEYNTNIANNIRIIYGGSVNANNAHSLFEQKDIDGGLVGGSSLRADAFIDICKVQ